MVSAIAARIPTTHVPHERCWTLMAGPPPDGGRTLAVPHADAGNSSTLAPTRRHGRARSPAHATVSGCRASAGTGDATISTAWTKNPTAATTRHVSTP